MLLIPVAHILIYSFVFSYIFDIRAAEEYGETEFVIFMMIGYLPWFAFAEAVGKSTGLLLEKAPLITKVLFPVQIIPVVGTTVPYLIHGVGFGLLLAYLATQGYLSIQWILLPIIFLLQFLFTMGLVATLSAFCVFLRDLQQTTFREQPKPCVCLWPSTHPNLCESQELQIPKIPNPFHIAAGVL